VTVENENEIAEWMKSYEALPEDRRDMIQRWFAMQKLIIESSGIGAEDWFRHIQWAMDNPFDYSFVNAFPEKEGGALAEDSAKATDETRAARKLVGGEAKKAPVADGPGIKEKAKSEKGLEKELFNRFMSESMNKGRK
jgi:hypothetical protein